MNNKLKIALRCTKYFLVAALDSSCLLSGLEQTEAKARRRRVYPGDSGRGQETVTAGECQHWCYRFPGWMSFTLRVRHA